MRETNCPPGSNSRTNGRMASEPLWMPSPSAGPDELNRWNDLKRRDGGMPSRAPDVSADSKDTNPMRPFASSNSTMALKREQGPHDAS
jgi:hypothetical protein